MSRPAFRVGTRVWAEFCDRLAERVVLSHAEKTVFEQAEQFWRQTGLAYEVSTRPRRTDGIGSGAELQPLVFEPVPVVRDRDRVRAEKDALAALRKHRRAYGD